MKKKLLISAVLALVLVCLFAIAVGATTYNYSDEAGNVLYSATAELKANRFEMIQTESGALAKTDADGNSLTWYVVNDDNGASVRNITVKSIKTADAGVITDGKFTFTGDVTADNVVSVNFFGMEVKTFDDALFMTTASGSSTEYCQVANGKYLLFLYLPKTLTAIPNQFCYRTSLRVLEWEDKSVSCTTVPQNAFQYMANLKSLTIPEGIETLETKSFRECLSLAYLKFPSTMTRLEHDVFYRSIGFETVIFGENMTYIGYLNSDYKTVYNLGTNNFNIKYMYVPNTVNTTGSSFDTYRGKDGNYINVDRSLVFLFVGTFEEAQAVANCSADRHFKSAVNGYTSGKNSTTPGEAPVEYSVYIQNRAYYDNLNKDRHVLVYNVPKCVAYGHNYTTSVTAPTCTTVGYTTYTCTVCGDSYKANETAIDENAHVYDDVTDIECNNCGMKIEIECTEHSYAGVITAPDCVNGGFTTYTCTKCGDTYVDDATEALGHSYDKVVTEPTCTSKGYTTNTCSACGDTYVDSEVDMLEHSYVATNTYKDTLTAFTVGEVCSVCGEKGEVTEYAPLLTYKGYSAQIDGDRVTLGYNVNKETQAFLSNITYGVLIAVPNESDDLSAYEPVNPDLTISGTSTAVLRTVNKKYDSFNLFVDGFDASNYERKAVLCAFVTDGEKVDYLYGNTQNEVSQEEYAIPVTFAEIADACTPKYQVTFTCDETMGYLEGETSQTVYDGQSTSTVKAVAKEGYQFACWSDGTQKAEITVTPEKKAKITACFVPESTGLPVMTINTEGAVDILTKEYYINCEITLLDNTEKGKSVGSAVAEIKGRGNSTWEKFDKKPYKFKFDKKQNLFGYGKEKTWVLLADYRDYSLVRNMLALNAGLTMSELQCTSMGQSVELYLNGEYRGVYYLCEQIQIKENRVNVTEEDEDLVQLPEELGYLVEMDGWAIENKSSTPNLTTDGDIYVTVGDSLKSNRAYAIKDPEDVLYKADGTLNYDYVDYVQNYLATALAAVQGNDYALVEELINVKSFAQAYIIYELFKNPDTNYSSVYFYWDKDGALQCGPIWDFDMAIGNVSHKGNGVFESTETLWTAAQNPWFKALLKFDEFKALVGEELAANEASLRASIANDLAYARAHADAYKKNFEAWDIMGKQTWSNPSYLVAITSWEKHLVYVENYLNESLAFLIETYPAPTSN